MSKYAVLTLAIAGSVFLSGCNSTGAKVPVVEAGTKLTPGTLRDINARQPQSVSTGQYYAGSSTNQASETVVVSGHQTSNRIVVEHESATNTNTQAYNQPWSASQTPGQQDWQAAEGQARAQLGQQQQVFEEKSQDYQAKLRSAQANYAQQPLPAPVQALITSAEQSAQRGDFNNAAAQLERAQRIAPAEPIILHRLSEIYLAQGEPATAEQMAQRGLSLSNNKPALQASFWELIARSRDERNDAAGAAQARERAKVLL
ncbi:tetratricopeptide repeat protein [Pseudomonas sp. F1_0610]|uniref:tetratricopeptide repeat protein n=1 Tax=Pseudomonas sp. F1_0610 TaxID=3114284 RepID=UPI0039C37EC5